MQPGPSYACAPLDVEDDERDAEREEESEEGELASFVDDEYEDDEDLNGLFASSPPGEASQAVSARRRIRIGTKGRKRRLRTMSSGGDTDITDELEKGDKISLFCYFWSSSTQEIMKKSILDSIPTACVIVAFATLAFIGLAQFGSEMSQIGARDGIDFIWQLIGFTFVLAALSLNIDIGRFSKEERKSYERIGGIFFLSGFLMFVAFGLMAPYFSHKEFMFYVWMMKFGSVMFLFAILLLCIGMSAMAGHSIRKIFR